jgi:hypothetical protein
METAKEFMQFSPENEANIPKTIEPHQEELNKPSEDYFAESGSSPPPNQQAGTSHLTDDQIFERILRSDQKEKFNKLFHEGDITGYPSQSEADAALCTILSLWTGGDPIAIDRIFRQSKLFSPKWDENQGAKTDGQFTIEWVIQRTKELYESAIVLPYRGMTTFDWGDWNRNNLQESDDTQSSGSTRIIKPVRFSGVSYPPREYLVKGYPLFQKQLLLLDAAGGVGKSILALHMLRCFATGEPLFGKYEILRHGPVILFDEETPEPLMIERLNGFGLRDPKIDGYLFHFTGVSIFDSAIENYIQDIKPVFVVIDSLTRVHESDENSNTEMKGVMRACRQLSNMGPLVKLLHHVNKETRAARGASEIVNMVDLELQLVPHKDGIITLRHGKCRVEYPEEINLKLSFGEKYDVRYQGTVRDQLWDRISEILSEEDAPMAAKSITEKLEAQGQKFTQQKVRNVLEARVSIGYLTKIEMDVPVSCRGGKTRITKVDHYQLN